LIPRVGPFGHVGLNEIRNGHYETISIDFFLDMLLLFALARREYESLA
jgi:hypothetical protein